MNLRLLDVPAAFVVDVFRRSRRRPPRDPGPGRFGAFLLAWRDVGARPEKAVLRDVLYFAGFMLGFDGTAPGVLRGHERVIARFDEGRADGRAAWDAVVAAGLVDGGDVPVRVR